MVPQFAVGYIVNDPVSNRRPIRVGRQEDELRTAINESGDKPGASHPIDLYFFARDPFHDSACFHQSLRDCIHPAVRLASIPYFAGGILMCIAGAFNPQGMILILISAAASTFGGTSALMWTPNLLNHGTLIPYGPQ